MEHLEQYGAAMEHYGALWSTWSSYGAGAMEHLEQYGAAMEHLEQYGALWSTWSSYGAAMEHFHSRRTCSAELLSM
jgi:hypothetical protein